LPAEDAGNMLFMYRRENVLPVDLEKQVKSDNTTGLKTNNALFITCRTLNEAIVFYCNLFFII
jgi:hypothetical protein